MTKTQNAHAKHVRMWVSVDAHCMDTNDSSNSYYCFINWPAIVCIPVPGFVHPPIGHRTQMQPAVRVHWFGIHGSQRQRATCSTHRKEIQFWIRTAAGWRQADATNSSSHSKSGNHFQFPFENCTWNCNSFQTIQFVCVWVWVCLQHNININNTIRIPENEIEIVRLFCWKKSLCGNVQPQVIATPTSSLSSFSNYDYLPDSSRYLTRYAGRWQAHKWAHPI